MDIRKSIKLLSGAAWRPIKKCPFGEVLLFGGLLIVSQAVYTEFNKDVTTNSPTLAAATSTSAIQADPSNRLGIAQLVDSINDPDALVHRFLNQAPSMLPQAARLGSAPSLSELELAKLALAETEEELRVAKAKLARASRAKSILAESKAEVARATAKNNAGKQAVKKARIAANKPTDKAGYQFSKILSQALFNPIKSNVTKSNELFAKNANTSELAFWETNKQFALAKKSANAPRKNKRSENRDFVIMLDPGHGGTDPGSIGHNGLQEKFLTLDIAKRAQKILGKKSGVRVLLTRDSDTGLSRKNRVGLVKNSQADMIVSVHLNHLPQTDVNLVETYFAAPHNINESLEKQRKARKGFLRTGAPRTDLSFTEGSRTLAKLLQKNVYEEVIQSDPTTHNAGIKDDTLYILTRSFTPGALIELSCLSNIQEAERLAEPAYRQQLAEALARGVGEYLKTPAAKKSFGSRSVS